MKWREATLQQLVMIRYHDDRVKFADKIEAEREIIRRQREERSGKPVMITKRMVVRR